MEAMIALQKESDYPLMGYTDKLQNFLSWYRFYQHEFIDWENWRCDFSDPNFVSMLEIASNAPENAEATYFEIINKAISEQKPFFMYQTADVYTYQAMNQLFGGNVAFVNSPNSSAAMDVEALTIYAVAANSPYKEAAWGIIKGLISEEYQQGHADTSSNRLRNQSRAVISGVPVSRSALELVIEDGLKEGGGFTKGARYIGGGDCIMISQLEPERVAEARRLWEQDMRMLVWDENIQTIIEEEVTAYFDGFIARERLIENLNNRVQLYLNEIKP
jgi:hypothetical protein